MKITKLSLYNDEKIVIENYKNIIDLNDGLIIIDKYHIKGDNLKIKQIEEYYIVIVGIIFEVQIKSDRQ